MSKTNAEKQALPGKRGNLIHAGSEAVTIVVSRDHFLFDERALDPLTEEFIASIEESGVQSPVWIWKSTLDGDPVYLKGEGLVVAGRRRVRAVREINERRQKAGRSDLLTIPCTLISTKGMEPDEAKKHLVGLMLLENELRAEDTPLGKARKTKLYLDCNGWDKADAAKKTGVTVKTVEARIKLLDMAPPVQQQVEKGEIGFWAATELSTLPPEQQVEKAAELIATAEKTGKRPSVEAAKVTAGKGASKARERKAEAKAALVAAALAYGDAVEAKTDISGMKAALLEAARAYHFADKE